jgi:glycine/D-amino acid oxidase-like deaminating enzyme
VKVALHGGPPYDPDDPERKTDQQVVERVRAFMAKYLPGANGWLVSSRVCLYTMTPDEHFVIDFHPQYSNVVIASCCSGHGFKFSPVLGKILSDLALTGRTDHDISLFGVGRFTTERQ